MRKVSAETYLSMQYLLSYTDAACDRPRKKELWSLEDGSQI